MQCLICGKEIGTGRSLKEVLFEEDVLCHACRSKWIRHERHYSFSHHKAYALYEYDDGFSSALLQFKECGDEALAPVFLYPDREKTRKFMKGRTILLLPSSEKKNRERGFHHLMKMYEILKIPVMEPFVKTDSSDQKGKNYAERQAMRNTIALKGNVRIPGKVVLADDVITTGATMRGALRCLKGMDLDIRVFSVARTRHSSFV